MSTKTGDTVSGADIAATLRGAADQIQSSGWAPPLTKRDSELAATWAITDAAYALFGDNQQQVSTAAAVSIERVNAFVGMDIYEWEATDGRTQDQVVEMFRAAATLG